MRKPAQFFVASILAGFTLVCLSASAAAQKPDEGPASKFLVCFGPAEAT